MITVVVESVPKLSITDPWSIESKDEAKIVPTKDQVPGKTIVHPSAASGIRSNLEGIALPMIMRF